MQYFHLESFTLSSVKGETDTTSKDRLPTYSLNEPRSECLVEVTIRKIILRVVLYERRLKLSDMLERVQIWKNHLGNILHNIKLSKETASCENFALTNEILIIFLRQSLTKNEKWIHRSTLKIKKLLNLWNWWINPKVSKDSFVSNHGFIIHLFSFVSSCFLVKNTS